MKKNKIKNKKQISFLSFLSPCVNTRTQLPKREKRLQALLFLICPGPDNGVLSEKKVIERSFALS
jgi:hypothetical protein